MVFCVGAAHERVADPDATFTVALALAVAPAPLVQVKVNVVWAVSAPVDCDPDNPTWLDQPPDAAQDVAFVELHCSVDVPPVVMLVGVAVSTTLGAAAVTLTWVC